ncbi:hypothetical protein ACFSTC_34075 [Nonomuraea ferruginea]
MPGSGMTTGRAGGHRRAVGLQPGVFLGGVAVDAPVPVGHDALVAAGGGVEGDELVGVDRHHLAQRGHRAVGPGSRGHLVADLGEPPAAGGRSG